MHAELWGFCVQTTTFLASRSPSLIARPRCLKGIENQKGLVDGNVPIRLVHPMLRSGSRITCPRVDVGWGQLGLLYSIKMEKGIKASTLSILQSGPAHPLSTIALRCL